MKFSTSCYSKPFVGNCPWREAKLAEHVCLQDVRSFGNANRTMNALCQIFHHPVIAVPNFFSNEFCQVRYEDGFIFESSYCIHKKVHYSAPKQEREQYVQHFTGNPDEYLKLRIFVQRNGKTRKLWSLYDKMAAILFSAILKLYY